MFMIFSLIICITPFDFSGVDLVLHICLANRVWVFRVDCGRAFHNCLCIMILYLPCALQRKSLSDFCHSQSFSFFKVITDSFHIFNSTVLPFLRVESTLIFYLGEFVLRRVSTLILPLEELRSPLYHLIWRSSGYSVLLAKVNIIR